MDKNNNNDEKNEKKGNNNSLEKSYFDVLGLCCSSEVPLIEKILKPLEGVIEVSVIVPSRTVIVLHDTLVISQHQIVIGTIVLKDYTEAGTIVFLFTIAEWLQSRASQKATAVMSSLMSMTPQQATIAETGEVVNVKDVKLNTILAVKAGELLPIDGVVVEGTCEVDEKTLTGESFPVPKQKDSNVWAGTVNVNGYVSVKTTALAEDCAVAKMARLVEEAQNNKSNVQRLIDKCAMYYTPAVVLISAGLAVVPIAMKLHDRKHWFHLALVVLVSACPCGLILSTPVATFCALSRAATSGLLVKGGDYLEILAKIKHMAFDKTGTITRGEFTLTDIHSLADYVTLTELLHWVSSIESKSSHPVAAVLVDYGRSQGVEPKQDNVEDFQNFPGEGVFGKINGRNIYIGNEKLGQRANCTVASNIVDADDHTKEARTRGYVYSEGALIGTFSLSDDCRSGAAEAIKELKSMGIRTALLTGDNWSTARRAQEQLGQALDAVHAELLPEDKAIIIKDYKKDGFTAMVGDGVNDAPALATADVGISMGVSGSALATETGHVILMSNDIRKIPKAIKLARKTRRKVIENIVFSITAKAGVIAFAIAGHPLVWLAVLVDVLTCLMVIFNSMLLLRGSGHGHSSSRCFGLFSSGHSHKTEHHHSKMMTEQCCSKNAVPHCSVTPCQSTKASSCGPTKCSSKGCSTTPSHTTNPKSCEPTRCSSKGCSTAPCYMISPKSCEPTKCSSKGCTTTPSQTTHPKSCVPTRCSSQGCSTTPCQTINPKSCELTKCSSKNCTTTPSETTDPNPCEPTKCSARGCSTTPSQTTNPESCESAICSSQSCSTPCQTAAKQTPESPKCCQNTNQHLRLADTNHDSNEKYYHSSEDHYLDFLESQTNSCGGTTKKVDNEEITMFCGSEIKHDALKLEEQKSSCCEGHNDVNCQGQIQTAPGESSIVISVLPDKNEQHCLRSHENHAPHHHHHHEQHHVHNEPHHHHHHHHHHPVVSHPVCHANTVAKHACSSLRKRENRGCCKSFRKECCSNTNAQGHIGAAFGGLTEIVTE
ncbi:cadmium/zinc-transporting ATPase HMA2 isoform X2 [Beta vulgaris subsp. vulgaris]|uniref:cadmium/zinc-transporting ATPase HMA2 isoform X2 n=1 Tax=Beta vulgaris subsp. vulgaris TaxID=3555 RepID=UPI002036F569|nr:cadmium/zinc-transporting ATPase HMA2 isoform X2 [Beta vulgaris subsp. vulgaris]